MTNNRKYLKKIDKGREVANVEVGYGRSLRVEGVGSIQLKQELSSGKTTNCVVKNVLFGPVGKLAESGRVVRFMENNKIYGEQGKSYFLNCSSDINQIDLFCVIPVTVLCGTRDIVISGMITCKSVSLKNL